jgi:hypothetical protein
MSKSLFQEFIVSCDVFDDIVVGRLPGWLFEYPMAEQSPGKCPCAACTLIDASVRRGDGGWVCDVAKAWIGDEEIVVLAVNDIDTVIEFAHDCGCGIETLATDVVGVGDVVCLTADPSVRVLEVAAATV